MYPQQSKQYAPKKSPRKVDPNAPPRPTLLGHEVQMKNLLAQDTQFAQQIQEQKSEINKLQSKVRNLESTVSQLLAMLSKHR